jgi:hypothetical protein
MAQLKKYTLAFDSKKAKWALKNDATNQTVKSFDTKQDAIKGGVLQGALGKQGGSVKIQKQDGKFQEERTFPGSADPPRSKG